MTVDSNETDGDDAGDRPLVLVIEDEEDLAELYGEYLSRSYEVRTANTGPEAVVLLDDEVDVVVLDRNLGNWTGEVILSIMQEKGIDSPVVMVTGIDPEPEVARLPVTEYLNKPVELDALAETIEELYVRSSYPKTEQELLALLSRREVLEDAHSEAVLAERQEYANLNRRIELALTELDERPVDLQDSKFRPSKCPACDHRWDIQLGEAVGFRPLGSHVWKCIGCGNVESVPDPERRRVRRG